MNQEISKTITLLRFPLACIIVLKHYYTPDISCEVFNLDHGGLYHGTGEFFTSVIGVIPVPLFFIISGYLYFQNCSFNDGFTKSIYLNKTKKRLKSLLIPYLLWNLLVFILFSLSQYLTSDSQVMSKEGYKLLSDYTFIDYIKVFWALDSTDCPVDGPLWFIRDLFVISIFSPLVYYGIKYLKWTFIVILFVLGYLNISLAIPFLHYTFTVSLATVFFTMGGAFALLAPETPLILKEKQELLVSIIAIFCIIGLFYSVMCEDYLVNAFTWSVRVFGSVLFFLIALWLVNKGFSIPVYLSTASFFIFAIHKPIQVIIRRLLFAIIHPSNEIILTSFVIFVPSIVVIISLFIFLIIKYRLPWLKCLNGYRL